MRALIPLFLPVLLVACSSDAKTKNNKSSSCAARFDGEHPEPDEDGYFYASLCEEGGGIFLNGQPADTLDDWSSAGVGSVITNCNVQITGNIALDGTTCPVDLVVEGLQSAALYGSSEDEPALVVRNATVDLRGMSVRSDASPTVLLEDSQVGMADLFLGSTQHEGADRVVDAVGTHLVMADVFVNAPGTQGTPVVNVEGGSVRVIGGRLQGSGLGDFGVALYSEGAPVELDRVELVDSNGEGQGGVRVEGAALTVRSSAIGDVLNVDGDVFVERSTFTGAGSVWGRKVTVTRTDFEASRRRDIVVRAEGRLELSNGTVSCDTERQGVAAEGGFLEDVSIVGCDEGVLNDGGKLELRDVAVRRARVGLVVDWGSVECLGSTSIDASALGFDVGYGKTTVQGCSTSGAEVGAKMDEGAALVGCSITNTTVTAVDHAGGKGLIENTVIKDNTATTPGVIQLEHGRFINSGDPVYLDVVGSTITGNRTTGDLNGHFSHGAFLGDAGTITSIGSRWSNGPVDIHVRIGSNEFNLSEAPYQIGGVADFFCDAGDDGGCFSIE